MNSNKWYGTALTLAILAIVSFVLGRRKANMSDNNIILPIGEDASNGITLPIQEDVEDRMVLRAINPDDRRDWLRILPVSTPMFIHTEGGSLWVRWWMARAQAERFGFWGAGCQCCGAGVDLNGDVWEYDSILSEVEWYLRGGNDANH